MACDAIQTTANTATANGKVSAVSSHEKSIAASGSVARPVGTGAAPGPCATKTLDRASIVNGRTAPAATKPETLFSTVSRISRGFLKPGGSAAARESFAAHTPTINIAGSQKATCANHGSAVRCSGVSARNHRYAP